MYYHFCHLCLIVLLGLRTYVQGQQVTMCGIEERTASTPLSQLSDLRTPTPWTYTDTLTYYSCSLTSLTATPSYNPQWFTAVVSGVSFPGENELIWPPGTDVASTDTTYEYITFPGLTITNLHPGDAITISWFQGGSYSGCVFVPPDATTASSPTTSAITTTAAPSPTTLLPASTDTTSSTSTAKSSSSNTGAIAGGVVGGVAALGAIAAVLIFCLRRRPNAAATPYPTSAVYNEPEKYNREPALRYPEQQIEPLGSPNIARDY